MTELDKRLQDMAAKDWQAFAQLIGEDALTAAKVCMLRQQGKSYAQISNRLKITERQAGYACNKCEVTK